MDNTVQWSSKNLLAILLTEDNEGDAALIRRYTEPFAMTTWARSVGEAVRQLETGLRADVILLDMNLPDKSGIEAVREIRKWSSAPLLVVTGDEDAYKAAEMVMEGADDYIVKENLSERMIFRRIKIAVARRSYLCGQCPNHEARCINSLAGEEFNCSEVQERSARLIEKLELLNAKLACIDKGENGLKQ